MPLDQESSPRVVVTGFGIHAAVPSFNEAFAALEQGRCHVGWHSVSHEAEGLRCVGAAASTEPPLQYLVQKKWIKYMGMPTQFAVWAAGKALEHAGLSAADRSVSSIRESMAIYLATGPIAFELEDVLPGLLASLGPDAQIDYSRLGAEGLRNSSPMMPFHTLLNMPIGLVSMNFGIQGPNAIFYPDAEQAWFALSAATRAVRAGRAKSALVGGTAQLLSLMPVVTSQRRGYLADAPETSIPFAPVHRGRALGDAAAMVVLEEEAHARARGAKIYGAVAVEPLLLDLEELNQRTTADQRRADCALVTGTRDRTEDEEIARTCGAPACFSLDSILGYAGPASLALHLAAACHLLDHPASLDADRWMERGVIDVLGACANDRGSNWAKIRLSIRSEQDS